MSHLLSSPGKSTDRSAAQGPAAAGRIRLCCRSPNFAHRSSILRVPLRDVARELAVPVGILRRLAKRRSRITGRGHKHRRDPRLENELHCRRACLKRRRPAPARKSGDANPATPPALVRGRALPASSSLSQRTPGFSHPLLLPRRFPAAVMGGHHAGHGSEELSSSEDRRCLDGAPVSLAFPRAQGPDRGAQPSEKRRSHC